MSADNHELNTTDTRSVVRWLDSNQSQNPRSFLIMFIALGGVFVDAYDFSSLSIGTVQLRQQMHLASWQIGLISSAMAFSALFGALTGGYLVDKVGRLKMFLLDLYFFVVSAIGAALSINLDMLLFFRLMMGLGAGLDFPVALSFVSEFAARKHRGRFVNFSYMNWYLAAIVGYLFTYLVFRLGAGANLWRYAVGFGAIPAVIILVLRFKHMEESPLWAAHWGKGDKVAHVLKRVYGFKPAAPPRQTPGTARAPHSWKDFKNIFHPLYRRRTFLASVIAFTQSIEYFAVIFYLPVIAQMLFGQKLVYAILGGMFFSVFGLLASFIQAWICDRTGIRRLALIGYAIVVVSLLAISLAHQMDSLPWTAAFVALFLFGHAFGPGPQGMAMGALSFPTAFRGSAIGWTQGMLRIGSIVGSFAFPLLLAQSGFNTTFIALAIVPLAGGLITLLIRWEPVGKDIEGEWHEISGQIEQTEAEVELNTSPT